MANQANGVRQNIEICLSSNMFPLAASQTLLYKGKQVEFVGQYHSRSLIAFSASVLRGGLEGKQLVWQAVLKFLADYIGSFG